METEIKHVPCTHCGSDDTYYIGLQYGYHVPSRRKYSMPCYQCNNPDCETSYGLKNERRFVDDGTLVEREGSAA